MTKTDFWRIRAEKYDDLKWVNDNVYLNIIYDHCQPKSSDSLLDLGIGTGKITKTLGALKYVAGLDISSNMSKFLPEHIHFVEGNIYDIKKLFKNKKFDIITARMVFHHCHSDLSSVIKSCYKLLNKNGRLVIAESIPPSKMSVVKKWWHETRLLKEKRTTRTYEDYATLLLEGGFGNIKSDIYTSPQEESSTVNWLDSSGLDLMSKYRIIRAHLGAPQLAKKAHKMKITKDDILCEHRHLIISGQK